MFKPKTPITAIPVDAQQEFDVDESFDTHVETTKHKEQTTQPTPEKVSTVENKTKVLTGEWIDVGSGIPSKGLAYPKPFKIRYRPYNFEELETVNGSDLNVHEQYNLILEGIQVDGFPLLDLTLGDFLYIMLMRKVTSLGTEYITVNYSVDGVAHSHDINVFSINYSEIDVPALPIRVKSVARGTDIIFKPLTVGNYLSYLRGEYGHNLKEKNSALALSIDNLPFEDAYAYVSTSTGLDSINLNKVDKLLYHGLDRILLPVYEEQDNPQYSEDLDPEIKKITPRTLKIKKGEVPMDLTDSSLLLLPFRESINSEDGGIRFG